VLTSPSGGEVWQAGTVQYIDFTAENIEEVVVSYSLDGGENYEPDIFPVQKGAPDWGHFPFTVPATPSANVVISLSDYMGSVDPVRSAPLTFVASGPVLSGMFGRPAGSADPVARYESSRRSLVLHASQSSVSTEIYDVRGARLGEREATRLASRLYLVRFSRGRQHRVLSVLVP
jgi:hypothetical protein